MRPIGSSLARVVCLALLLLTVGSVTASSGDRPPASGPSSHFKIYNAMLYKRMPQVGIRIPVVYEKHFFPANESARDGRPTRRGIVSAVRNAEEQITGTWRADESLVALDIERWLLWPQVTGRMHRESVERYRDSIKEFRAVSKRAACLYGVAPSGGIVQVSRAAAGSQDEEEWNTANDVVAREVVPFVDALCPPLYTFYGAADPETETARHRAFIDQWKLFATRTIAQARRIGGGRPVYAFVWPQYHVGGSFKDFRFIPAEYWREQLETLKAQADGIILWGGWNFEKNEQLDWDADAPWWQVTKDVFGLQ
ncbi:MAG: hypothetical protein AB7G13_05685 [Lautropia sp.]